MELKITIESVRPDWWIVHLFDDCGGRLQFTGYGSSKEKAIDDLIRVYKGSANYLR